MLSDEGFRMEECMTDSTRRVFLTAGAAAAMPLFIKGEKKAGEKLPIVGEGEHTYECIHDWGELPSNIKYGNTHSVCEDSQGHIYIHHTVHATSQSPDAVVVFDNNGKFVRSWGAMFKGGAHGMQYAKVPALLDLEPGSQSSERQACSELHAAGRGRRKLTEAVRAGCSNQ